MTTSTYHPPTIDREAIAREAIAQTARRLQIREAQVVQALAMSAWRTPEEMIEREFAGAYRGYFPKCSMDMLSYAILAEIFDALAIALGDPRRALRSGAWTPPGGWSGGHSDG